MFTRIILVGIVSMWFGSKVAAENNIVPKPECYDYHEIKQSLFDSYQEKPHMLMLVDPTVAVEVFVSDSGSWTMMAVGEDGQACLMSSGQGVYEIPLQPGNQTKYEP